MKLVLDNTRCTAIERCPQYDHYRSDLDLVPIAIATPLTFGGAFHIGLQTYYDKNRNVVDACADFAIAWEPYEGLDQKRTTDKGQELLLAWDEQFHDEPWIDKSGEIEFSLPCVAFCPKCGKTDDEPWKMTGSEVCSCGQEVLLVFYAGIIDRIGLYHNEWTIHEFKTSSSPRDFVVRPNNQVTGYVWGAQALLGQPFKNSLVTIAGVYKSSEKGYYTPTVDGKKSKTPVSVIVRHYTPRSTDEISAFLARVRDAAYRVWYYHQSNTWPRWTESCAYKYGLCPYQPLCQAPLTQFEFLVETAYRKEKWVPGKRTQNENV